MVLGSGNRRANGLAAGGALRRALLAAVCALAAMGAMDPAGAAPPAPVNTGAEWRIVKEAWAAADEQGFEDFVQAIGRSDCATLEDCLDSEANPYRHTDHRQFSGDCADMAYILRAYYAWKNGLPFSYQNAMRTADGSGEDLRYSTSGNIVAARRGVAGPTPVSAPGFIARIGGEVSTAMFRTHPQSGGGHLFNDFYPIKIGREAVRPGVVAYDIYGHAGIVYDVLDDGRILIVASHPDNSITRTTYGPNFMRAKPALGAGLKAWRPIYIEGARRASNGQLHGGKLRAAPNEAIADFSLEQFYGNAPNPNAADPNAEWHDGEFRLNGRTLSYYDYVRRKLAAPDFAYNPVDELRHGLQTICRAIKGRKVAVDRAVANGVHLRRHPDRLPYNIYGTYGLWENYSTPSRDARLKVSFIELRRAMQELVEHEAAGDPSVRYAGADLPRDLWTAFEEEKSACTIIYRRSDATRVKLNLGHVMDRLWGLSFDPFHCPERRWGASGAELETCRDDAEKTRWYNAQRFLRYQAERSYDVRMDFTVDELQPPMVAAPSEGGLGVDAPADANLRAYIARLNKTSVAALEDPPELLAISAAPDDRPEGRSPHGGAHFPAQDRGGR